MPKLLMVPLDGSAFAEQALPLALAIARDAGARLHLVMIRTSLPLDESAHRAEQAYLQRVASQLAPQLPGGVTHEVVISQFGPLNYPPPIANFVADALVGHATAEQVDLIVTTTHGRGGVRRAWLGSVADALARLARQPIVLVRPKDEQFTTAAQADHIQHILIPLDGSPTAERAIPAALAIGEPFDAHYTLLRVVSPLSWDMPTETFHNLASRAIHLDLGPAREELEFVAERMRSRGAVVQTHVIEGPPIALAIVDYAAAHAVDLIAVASAGAGAVRRLFLGSVSDKVVRASDVPVLLVGEHTVAFPTRDQFPLVTAASTPQAVAAQVAGRIASEPRA